MMCLVGYIDRLIFVSALQWRSNAISIRLDCRVQQYRLVSDGEVSEQHTTQLLLLES